MVLITLALFYVGAIFYSESNLSVSCDHCGLWSRGGEPSFKFVLLTIVGCGVVTWLSRILPFVLLKRFSLSKAVIEYLSFVPVVIMSALWFSNLFTPHLGQLPTLNVNNLLASLPTVLAAIISKNLLVIVLVGLLSLTGLRLLGW